MPVNLWSAPNLDALPMVMHGFSQRMGGVSAHPFESLNLALHVADETDAVLKNRTLVADQFGLPLSQMVCAEQVHGGQVAIVSSADAGRGSRVIAEAIRGVDALITDTPDLLLALFFADCVPLFFADAQRGVIAVAHAGWRGLVAGVIENTLETIQTRFGSDLCTVQAAIGPCIGPEWFEVGPEVATHFPESIVPRESQTDKRHVDLAAATRERLTRAGMPAQNILVSGICTASCRDSFFSHRRDGGQTGRMGAFIRLQLRAAT